MGENAQDVVVDLARFWKLIHKLKETALAKRPISAVEAVGLLREHWCLVLVRGHYWLMDRQQAPQFVSNAVVKRLMRQIDFDSWKIEAWTADRALSKNAAAVVAGNTAVKARAGGEA